MTQPTGSPGHQTNIRGHIHTDGGTVNTGNIHTGGGTFIGRDQINITRLDPEDKRNQRNHAALRAAVRRFWVDGYLKHSIYNEIRIRLNLEPQDEAVNNRPWDLEFLHPNQPEKIIASDADLADIFDRMGHQLLILGEPGSGKTTTLLTLAGILLDRAEADPTLPTPAVFNLSSWAEKQPPLTDWLVEELNTRYKMPPKFSQGWVENDELLLLLDGLDEVAEGRRDACVSAINAFQREHVVAIVVCSRTVEYEALAGQLQLAGAVAVRPLSQAQIDDYVTQTRLPALRAALQQNTELQQLAQTPLMLSVMTLAYQDSGAAGEEKGQGHSGQQYLFDRYIHRMFQHRTLPHLYAPAQTVHWLQWLAAQMITHSQMLFFIEYLQPDWISGSARYLRVTLALLYGLFGLIYGPLGLIYGLVVGLLVSPSISMRDRIDFAGPKLNRHELHQGLSAWLTFGLIMGVIFGVYDGLNDESVFVMISGLPARVISIFLGWLLFWLVVGLAIGLIFTVIIGLAFMISSIKFKPEKDSLRVRPNQGIRHSLRNWLTWGLITGLIIGANFGLIPGSIYALIFLLVFALIYGMAFGGDAVIKHSLLRLLMTYQGVAPLNYARFLDYAAARLFLRKVGGGYIFVHRLLLEHFASLTDKDIERITAELE